MQGEEAGDRAPRSPQCVPSSRASGKGDWRSQSHPSLLVGVAVPSRGMARGRPADAVSKDTTQGTYCGWPNVMENE